MQSVLYIQQKAGSYILMISPTVFIMMLKQLFMAPTKCRLLTTTHNLATSMGKEVQELD